MKILVRIPNWIGDAVMSIPSIEVLKFNFKGSEISLIGRKPAIEIFYNYPGISEIFEIKGKSILNEIKTHRKIIKNRFDKAYLLPNSFKSAFTISFAKPKEIIGYLNEGRGIFLTKRIKQKYDKTKHFSFYYRNLILSEGLKDKKIEKIQLFTAQKEKEYAEKFLKSRVLENSIKIGISPGAAYGDSKKWFPERFRKTAEYFEKKYNAKIFLFGSSKDSEDCKKVETEKSINLCGKTSLREAMALIERMDLFLSNDSGLMHLANALDVPVVAIFGPTIPTFTYPYNKNHKIVFHKVECSPCTHRTCPLEKKLCMESVSVKEVIEKGEELLSIKSI